MLPEVSAIVLMAAYFLSDLVRELKVKQNSIPENAVQAKSLV